MTGPWHSYWSTNVWGLMGPYSFITFRIKYCWLFCKQLMLWVNWLLFLYMTVFTLDPGTGKLFCKKKKFMWKCLNLREMKISSSKFTSSRVGVINIWVLIMRKNKPKLSWALKAGCVILIYHYSFRYSNWYLWKKDNAHGIRWKYTWYLALV